jgi:hypothetical protein
MGLGGLQSRSGLSEVQRNLLPLLGTKPRAPKLYVIVIHNVRFWDIIHVYIVKNLRVSLNYKELGVRIGH